MVASRVCGSGGAARKYLVRYGSDHEDHQGSDALQLGIAGRRSSTCSFNFITNLFFVCSPTELVC
jgi:hypothetical protein